MTEPVARWSDRYSDSGSLVADRSFLTDRRRTLPTPCLLLAVALAGCASAPRPSAVAVLPRLVGGCGEAPSALLPKYALPFPEGSAYSLTQGNCGRASHDGRFSFSFDFRMPIGTAVVAARDGVIYALREGNPNGTGRVGDENYVFVSHADGEISRYIHVTTNGVLVERGARVSRGDTIALSGHSGRSAFPHLHFDVSRGCGTARCVNVPAAFVNSEPPIPTALRDYLAARIP